jgi:alkaline phosphatase
MRRSFSLYLLLSISFVIFAAKPPKNIIFIIGDGMGLPQIQAGMIANGNKSVLEKCKNLGLIRTYSADNYTTDSGAGGTALATGVKTKNGMIGMGPDSVAVQSIMKYLDEKGLATGLVVSCAVTHATPASYVAHQINRNMYEEIAADFLKSDIDLFIGGGRKYFENRADNRNLIRELKDKKYRTLFTLDEVKKLKSSNKVAALLFEDHPPKAAERKNYLPEASATAINLLSKNNKGFFLMIESSQIDWACHANDSAHLIDEMLDFEKVAAEAINFAEKSGNTLVIITADHETGGLSMPTGNIQKGISNLKFSTKGHSGLPVPVFAYGPGSENFTGLYENTEFKNRIIQLMKLK